MNKAEIRQIYKTVRRRIVGRESCEEDILFRFTRSDEFRRCKTLFLYSSYGTEVATDKIAEKAFEDGKTVAYPVCTDVDGSMRFYIVSGREQLISGMYGIKEPDTSVCSEIIPDKDSLIVVPALVFDLDGNRLGYGKGYYDRYMHKYPCFSVGLAFEDCVTEKLPAAQYDKKVNILITDKKKYIFSITKEE